MNNLFYDSSAQDTFLFRGRNFMQTIKRLDTLLLVLKTCKGASCREPWRHLLEIKGVQTLADAMDSALDTFFDAQEPVSFSECRMGHLVSAEGPQGENTLETLVESGPLLWS